MEQQEKLFSNENLKAMIIKAIATVKHCVVIPTPIENKILSTFSSIAEIE